MTTSIEISNEPRATRRQGRGARLARIVALGLLVGGVAAAGAVATAGPSAGPAQCLVFDGRRHCSIGAATLATPAPGSRLEVRNPGQSPGAGVSIELPDVSTWTGGMRLQYAAGTPAT